MFIGHLNHDIHMWHLQPLHLPSYTNNSDASLSSCPKRLCVMASNDKETASAPTSTDNLTLVFDVNSSTDRQATDSKLKRSSFKRLFSFTRWNHTRPLIAAVIASAAFASIKSVQSIILGSIFDVVSDFGAGHRSGSETMDKISHWGLILLGMGVANWVSSTAFLALWIIFGELQANSARQGIFESLLSKKMSWYDSLDHGVSSLLVRIQTQVHISPIWWSASINANREIDRLESFNWRHHKCSDSWSLTLSFPLLPSL